MSRFSTFRGIPVALFGATGSSAPALLSIGGLTARPAVRENVPGYLFVLSTLALAVVLYLGYASFVLLKAVCLLCLTTYAAVIGLFLVSGAATSFPMTTLPRRAVTRPPRVRRQPAGDRRRRSVLRRRGVDARLVPARGRRGAGRSGRAGRRAGADPGSDARSSSAGMRSQPRVPLVVPAEGAKVLVVKFNDFQCPACGQSYLQYKPIFAKYEARASRRRQAGAEGLPAEPRLQRRARPVDSLRRRATRRSPCGWRRRTTRPRRWRSGSTRTSRR